VSVRVGEPRVLVPDTLRDSVSVAVMVGDGASFESVILPVPDGRSNESVGETERLGVAVKLPPVVVFVGEGLEESL
jgi:hypothetical protein